jgi:GNAT superfamily N-acetyltransferase
MQFRTFDELTPSMDADRLLVHLSSLGGATDRTAVALWRKRSNVFAEYVGVFAVERGRVIGQTLVKRLAYTFPEGRETIGAIASVGTRPDAARRGVARRILEEVHRREREAGIRFVSLWTNRSWGAHRLYEQLGYRDTYAFPWAVRPPPRDGRRSIAPKGVGPATVLDLAAIEELHARASVGRIGFCERPRAVLRTAALLGEFDPAQEMLVRRSRSGLSGYATVRSNAVRSVCGELVGRSRRDRIELVRAVEHRAGVRAVAFQHTPVTDQLDLLRARGYATMLDGWYVFMTASLRGPWSERAARAQFRPEDPRFQCAEGDRF